MTDALEPLGVMGRSAGAITDQGRMVLVALASGAGFPVHRDEVEYLTTLAARYMDDLHFVNIVDLQDLDRLLMVELMCFRWASWLSRGCDYDAGDIDSEALEKSLMKASAEARQIKAMLDVTKRARDKAKGEDSVPNFLTNLLARAKEFGVHREEQLGKALELFNELQSMVGLYQRCDQQERDEMDVDMEDIFDWIVTVAIPEYRQLDDYFRTHAQRYWVRDL